MRKKKRKNWKKFFEQNPEEEFTMYRIIRNLPYTKDNYSDAALQQLRCVLQKRYKRKINV